MEKESGISKAFGNAKESIKSGSNRAAEAVGLKEGKFKHIFVHFKTKY